jgi:hypothetical protein
MENRLKNYINYVSEQLKLNISQEEREILKKNLLVQIQFFQHERLIHLIVTVTFALLSVMTLFYVLSYQNILINILLFLMLVLLFPYIRHYFILERGVQKLYEYYDKL